MEKLTPAQITEALTSLPGWQLKSGTQPQELERQFTFPDFAAAMRFVHSVAALAEQAGHHPDIDIRYNKVRLALSTHDAGGITAKDISLAAAIAQVS